MKKFFLFLFLFLIPFKVFALPKTGVYYFFTYPNGYERVSENYEDTENEEEILLYSGTSDSNGEVVLPQFDNQGTLRIVEKVPNGYSIESKEITVDLSRQSSVEFVNTKGMINPKTGRSILLIVEVLFVVFGFFFVLKRKSKVKLLTILILLGIVLFTSVKAEQQDFTIIVRDKDGKRLSNVEVEVYSKAVSIDASPAVKVLANGGVFLDGETTMYLKLPYSGCSYKEFMENLTSSDNMDSLINLYLAYSNNNSYPSRFEEEKETYNHGDVLHLRWLTVPGDECDGSPCFLNLDFNGGVFYFRGKQLTGFSHVFSDALEFSPIIFSRIKNGESHFIGFDNQSSCSIYDSYGVQNPDLDIRPLNNMYLCWNDRPDGIYVNDTIFLGNTDSCYYQSFYGYNYESNQLGFYNYFEGKRFYVGDATSDNPYMSPLFYSGLFGVPVAGTLQPRIVEDSLFPYDTLQNEINGVGPVPNANPIQKVEIVEYGQTVVSLTDSDLNLDLENLAYYISNSSKRSQFVSHFYTYSNRCR